MYSISLASVNMTIKFNLRKQSIYLKIKFMKTGTGFFNDLEITMKHACVYKHSLNVFFFLFFSPRDMLLMENAINNTIF